MFALWLFSEAVRHEYDRRNPRLIVAAEFLFLSIIEDDDKIPQALKAGAKGDVLKSPSIAERGEPTEMHGEDAALINL